MTDSTGGVKCAVSGENDVEVATHDGSWERSGDNYNGAHSERPTARKHSKKEHNNEARKQSKLHIASESLTVQRQIVEKLTRHNEIMLLTKGAGGSI